MAEPGRDGYRYSLRLTDGWYAITPVQGKDGPDTDGLISRLSLSEERTTELRAAVDTVWQFASIGLIDGSERWVLIGDPSLGRIDAVLSLDLHAARGESGPDAYVELARKGAAEDDSIEVINRTVERHELPVGTAVAIHDFALPRPDLEPSGPAIERAVVALFLTAEPMMVEFSLVTQDLGLTDSIGEYLMRIVGTFELEEAR
jgi:hypothetical protein